MPKKEAKRALSKGQKLILSLLLIAGAFAASYVFTLLAMTPQQYDVTVGSPSPATVYAPYDMVDEAATSTLVESARESVSRVYSIDDDAVDANTDGADEFLSALSAIRSDAYEYVGWYTGDEIDWSTALDEAEKTTLISMTSPNLTESQLYGVLGSTATELKSFRDIVLSKLSTSLEAGLSDSALNGVLSASKREINALSGISDALKEIAGVVFDEYMRPTLKVDEAATALAMDEAEAAVEPIVVKKGSLIVERQATVTSSQYALLSSFGLVKTDEGDAAFDIGIFIILLAAFTAFAFYVYIYQRHILFEVKNALIFAVFVTLTAALAYFCSDIDVRLNPSLIAVMLVALLVNERTALATGIIVALTAALMSGDGSGLDSTGAIAMLATVMAEATANVFTLRKTQSRSALIAAGAAGGVAGAIVSGAFELASGGTFIGVVEASAWTLGSAMVSALLVIGSLSVWENLFDVATSAKLSELSNTNHPLLRELMTDAPGTYQHSMMTAALAEGAAMRIGADPLLARVGAYFHDVGKLRRPLYFKENQKNGENIHDTLPPLESAQGIIAHQRDGVYLLNKARLPSAVVKICGEHHGNSLMTYFYAKAKTADPNVSEKGFRYSGNRPSSKESAIVMFADSCEAAVRSLGETDAESVERMTHKIIWSKLNPDENMMSNAPLTVAEIAEIEKSFLKTFQGLMHDRIEYPDMEALNK